MAELLIGVCEATLHAGKISSRAGASRSPNWDSCMGRPQMLVLSTFVLTTHKIYKLFTIDILKQVCTYSYTWYMWLSVLPRVLLFLIIYLATCLPACPYPYTTYYTHLTSFTSFTRYLIIYLDMMFKLFRVQTRSSMELEARIIENVLLQQQHCCAQQIE